MTVSRRALLMGGFASMALVGAGALTSCSTAPAGSGVAGKGGGQLVLWMWPDGFSKEVMSGVKDKFTDFPVRQDIIGGDFKQKLTTTFKGKSGLPGITGVKGEDMPYFRSLPDNFIDLNTLGAKNLKSQYLDWKWQQGSTVDGRLIGFPIDIGPTALFYRFDVFESAGLPSDPAEVSKRTASWDDYLEMGKELLSKKPGTFLIRNLSGVFDTVWRQQGAAFISEDQKFIGDESHVRFAWDTALKALDSGAVAKIQNNTPDVAAAVSNGTLPADFHASWHLSDLMNDAPDSSGKWHVANPPGGATNIGGSVLTIPTGTEDPERSFEVIKFMLNAENQAIEYTDKGNFPSSPASYELPALTGPVEFLGGQIASKVFAESAEQVKPFYEDPNDNTVNGPFYAEIDLVESQGKNPETAWKDAVKAAKALAKQVGVKVS